MFATYILVDKKKGTMNILVPLNVDEKKKTSKIFPQKLVYTQ